MITFYTDSNSRERQMEDLKDIRKQITETDNQMAELFSKRMQLVAKVAEYKRVTGCRYMTLKENSRFWPTVPRE